MNSLQGICNFCLSCYSQFCAAIDLDILMDSTINTARDSGIDRIITARCRACHHIGGRTVFQLSIGPRLHRYVLKGYIFRYKCRLVLNIQSGV
jgi:hypothetical protein